jgi:hypothetical protein
LKDPITETVAWRIITALAGELSVIKLTEIGWSDVALIDPDPVDLKGNRCARDRMSRPSACEWPRVLPISSFFPYHQDSKQGFWRKQFTI